MTEVFLHTSQNFLENRETKLKLWKLIALIISNAYDSPDTSVV